MKILIIGYGKMGSEIEAIALSNGHEISGIVSNSGELKDVLKGSENFDMAFEFSTPDSGFENIKACIEKGIPVVSGTTGWMEKLDEIKEIVRKKKRLFFLLD